MLNIDNIRADTRYADNQTFLNSAGSSLMPTPVVTAMVEYLHLEERVGGYEAFERESARLGAVYNSVAKLINASPAEIAMLGSATAAWQMAFYSLPLKAGDVVLTCEAEYGANFVALLQLRQRLGIEIVVVPSDATGEIDLGALRAAISPRVKLISLTWIPTNGGLVNPAVEVGNIAREHGVPYLLDACQAVGQMPVDVQTIGCDMLSATGRKFIRGPRGTGFLYVRAGFMDTLEPHTIDHFSAPWVERNEYRLRDDARRYETWEANYMANLGLGIAADYALNIGLDAIERRCTEVAGRLRMRLAAIPGVLLRDLGRHPSAIVTFTVAGIASEIVARDAGAANITIGASSPSSTRLDSERRGLPSVVRASPHYFNTNEDVDRLADWLEQEYGSAKP